MHTEFRDIGNYPPTSASAAQHVQRLYLQVMTWQGIHLDPLDWGFVMKHGCMLPLMCDEDVSPTIILSKIKCGCIPGCQRKCSCRNLGIECIINCKKYIENCANKTHYVDDGELDD